MMPIMGTFESDYGTETVDIPQEAIDTMITFFGGLQGKFSSDCIAAPMDEWLGPLDHASYGSPELNVCSRFGNSCGNDVLHIEYQAKLQHKLDADIALLEGIRALRNKMANLGFSAATRADYHGENLNYVDCYDKRVVPSKLLQELQRLESEFTDRSTTGE